MAVITTDSLKDKINQREILADVLTTAQKIGNLDNPLIVRTVQIKGLRGSIPMMGAVNVFEDVNELETSAFENTEFSNFEFDMKKDRIKLAITDEASLENNVADPFSLQKESAAQAIASSFDKQIATALTTTPMTLSDCTVGTDNFFKTFAAAIGKLAPYKTTAMAMTNESFYQLLSAIELRGANCVQNANGTVTIPAFPTVPVIISDNIPLATGAEGRVIFISNEVPAAIKAIGAVKTRVYEDEGAGALIFQSDLFRCVKSNIRQNASNLNMGAVSVNLQW